MLHKDQAGVLYIAQFAMCGLMPLWLMERLPLTRKSAREWGTHFFAATKGHHAA